MLFFTFFFSASLGECCGSWAGRSKKKRSSGPRLKIAAWPWLVLTWVPDYPSVHGVNASIPSGGQICRSLQDDFQEFQNFDDFDDFTLDGLEKLLVVSNNSASPHFHILIRYFFYLFFFTVADKSKIQLQVINTNRSIKGAGKVDRGRKL